MNYFKICYNTSLWNGLQTIYIIYMCIIDGLFSYFSDLQTILDVSITRWAQVSALSRSAWLRLDGLPSPGSQLDRAHGAPGASGCSGLLIGSHWFVSLSESRNFQPQQAQQTSKEDFWWFLPIGSEGNRGWQVDISPDLLHPEFLTQKQNGFQSWQGISRHFLSIYFLDMEFWFHKQVPLEMQRQYHNHWMAQGAATVSGILRKLSSPKDVAAGGLPVALRQHQRFPWPGTKSGWRMLLLKRASNQDWDAGREMPLSR